MKKIITCIIAASLLFAGCSQLIHERPDGTRLKINTLFTLTGFDGLYNDPNGFLEINKYNGVPANIKFVFNPLLNQYEVVIESEAKDEE